MYFTGEVGGLSVENEAKKKWLWRYREAMFKAESLWRQAQEWQNLIYEPSCRVLDGMPKRPGFSNTAERSIVKHIELIDEATAATASAKDIRKEITTAIKQVDNNLGARVLTLRYVEGFSWKEIQHTMNYSKSHVRNLHDSAISKLKIVQNSTK